MCPLVVILKLGVFCNFVSSFRSWVWEYPLVGFTVWHPWQMIRLDVDTMVLLEVRRELVQWRRLEIKKNMNL